MKRKHEMNKAKKREQHTTHSSFYCCFLFIPFAYNEMNKVNVSVKRTEMKKKKKRNGREKSGFVLCFFSLCSLFI